MNLKHLETFHYFCQFMSMSQAAQQLNVTQPAVSQQLRSFEAECGTKLFYREANQYKLTEAGETIFLVTKPIFIRVDQINALLEKTRRAASERLRIGATKSYARTCMPDLIARFQEHFPRVKVLLSEGNSADLIVRLREEREDLVVVARTSYDSSLKATPFAVAEFLLVCGPDHPLAKQKAIPITSLNGESLIIRERGSGLRNAILKKLAHHGVAPAVVVESDSLNFTLAYIERRMGVSFMLSHEIEDELATGRLRRVDLVEGNIRFQSDIVVRRDEQLSVPMRYFLQLAKKR